jgi:hypothetical protein
MPHPKVVDAEVIFIRDNIQSRNTPASNAVALASAPINNCYDQSCGSSSGVYIKMIQIILTRVACLLLLLASVPINSY